MRASAIRAEQLLGASTSLPTLWPDRGRFLGLQRTGRWTFGQHGDPAKRLHFPPEHQAVVAETGHLELLASEAVAGAVVRWLGLARTTARAEELQYS